MRYAAGVLTAILVQLATASPGWAQAEKYPPIPDTGEIIAHCLEIAKDMINAGGANGISGYHRTNGCLKAAIKENLSILVGKSAREGWSADKAIDVLSDSYYEFYQVLYNNNEACGISCGAFYHGSGAIYLNGFYEKILAEILKQRVDNEAPF